MQNFRIFVKVETKLLKLILPAPEQRATDVPFVNTQPSMTQYMLKQHNSSVTIQSLMSKDYKIYKFGNRVIDLQALYVQQVKNSFCLLNEFDQIAVDENPKPAITILVSFGKT